jgi:iron(III) transport system ATP-binding protein
MSELTLTDVHKSFGDHVVLAGLDLSVPAGSFTALLGPSGAGKTTLLRLLAGFETPDRGTIAVGGRVISDGSTHVAPEQRRVGYVPQEGSLFPHLTVSANIGFGLPRAQRRAAVGELLELVGLADLGGRYPHELSGGQQQRVALARALAVKPELVLLDEPFAALDAQLRAGVRDEVRQILGRANTTTLLVTHNQDEALSSADLVAVLRDGVIVQHASPLELYSGPVDGELACFVGDANLLDGVLDHGDVETPLGRLEVRWRGDPPPAGGSVTVLIRPEQIGITGTGRDGRVIRCGYHGHDTVLHVEIARGRDASCPPLLVRAPGNPQLSPGDRVSLTAHGPVLAWPNPSSTQLRIGPSGAAFETA